MHKTGASQLSEGLTQSYVLDNTLQELIDVLIEEVTSSAPISY